VPPSGTSSIVHEAPLQTGYTAATPAPAGPSSTSNGAGLSATGAAAVTPAGDRRTSENWFVLESSRLHAVQPPYAVAPCPPASSVRAADAGAEHAASTIAASQSESVDRRARPATALIA
jgi:hypothetical protein